MAGVWKRRRILKWLGIVLGAAAIAINLHNPLPSIAQSTPTNPAQVQAQTKQTPSSIQEILDAVREQEESFPDAPQEAVPSPVIPIDISQHWAADCITALSRRGIASANSEGYFYPDEDITWGAFIGALNLVFSPGQPGGWASPLEQALGLTNSANVVSHYPPQYYQPDRPLLRAEAMMALAAKVNTGFEITANTTLNNSLVDGAQVPPYAREGAAAALAQGVMVNYPEANRLKPTQRLTRGEAAALLCRSAPDSDLRRTIDPAWVAQATMPESLPVPEQELRGVWLTNIDSQVLFSTEALESAVNRLADLNFNTLYPTVWNWGYTLYPSATARREIGDDQHLYADLSTPELEATQGERDMMQEVVDFGHAKGMAVIPWFEFGFMAPANYELYRRHPDWFTQVRVEPSAPAGNEDIFLDNDEPGGVDVMTDPTAADPGIWLEGGVLPRRWMNPFHPQVQKFQLELINDLVSNYEVDGFQFDDHLGLPVEFGYDPYTINLYRSEHGGAEPPADPRDAEWMAWRAEKITNFLGEVYKLVKSRRPNAVVSISPNPYPFAYVNYLQDWPEWVEQGFVDELVIQIYRDDNDRFIWEMNKPSAQTALRKIPTSVGILSGLRARPVGMDIIGEQITAVRDRDLSGMSFFFYESLWIPPATETLDDRTDGLGQAFNTAVVRPNS
jgi:uncharacterized lipoprotein YddW (UPF0748 family)